MDMDLIKDLFMLLIGGLTLWQEKRHRKAQKTVSTKDIFPTRGRK